MQNRLARILVTCTLALCLFPSCASIVTGSTDEILVTSTPSGAFFSTNFGQAGITPSRVQVPCDQPLSVRYNLSGYQEARTYIGTRMSAWVVGNLVLGGILGLLIDASGNGYTHDSTTAHVELVPLPKRAPEPKPKEKEKKVRPIESFEAWEKRKSQKLL